MLTWLQELHLCFSKQSLLYIIVCSLETWTGLIFSALSTVKLSIIRSFLHLVTVVSSMFLKQPTRVLKAIPKTDRPLYKCNESERNDMIFLYYDNADLMLLIWTKILSQFAFPAVEIRPFYFRNNKRIEICLWLVCATCKWKK